MDNRLENLRNEMTKLQLEIGMMRQMLGSMTRAEQENVELLQSQTTEDTFDLVANLMPVEQQSVRQLQEMVQVAEQLRQQIQSLESQLQLGGAGGGSDVMDGGQANLPADPSQLTGMEGLASSNVNDPMQRPS